MPTYYLQLPKFIIEYPGSYIINILHKIKVGR